jgi:dienelactone hydrolase
MTHQRLDVAFDSDGTRCAAWLYLPAASTPPPVVVMAHGFSGVRDVRLPAFAERFAERGLACFVFDYRSFGDSGGEPRQVLDWKQQLRDWRSAVAHVRRMPEVDGTRVGVWGTSFGGGHAMVTAACDDDVAAVVAQVPHVDGAASLRMIGGLGYMAHAVAAGARDLVQSALGYDPYYVPAVSPPGAFGCFNTEDSYEGFLALVPPGSREPEYWLAPAGSTVPAWRSGTRTRPRR